MEFRAALSGARDNGGLAQAVKRFIRRHKGKRICFYGAGTYGKALVEAYDWSKIGLLGFIDRDPRKIGQRIGKYRIYPIAELKKLNPEYLVITIAGGERHYDAIRREAGSINRKVKVLNDVFAGGNKDSSENMNLRDGKQNDTIRRMETTIRELKNQVVRLSVSNIFNDRRTKSGIRGLLTRRKRSGICIYGAGSIARELLKRYDLSHMKILGFIDRDPEKAGKRLGLRVPL